MTKIKFLPKSNFGKWALELIVLMPVWFFIGMSWVDVYEYNLVSAGNTILTDIIPRPGVALPMLTGMVSGIAAGFIGIIGIFKKKDRSVLTILSTILGLLLLLWVMAEIIFPH